MRESRSLRLAALAGALLLSACTTNGATPSPSTSATSSASALPDPARPATPVPAGAAVATTSKDVAGYDPKAHVVAPDQPSSPDRVPLASSTLPAGFASPPPGSGRARYLSQKLTWSACGEQQCASVLVPLDWDHPDGQAITLRLRKVASSGEHKGTLFVNPGGPGAPGQGIVGRMSTDDFPGHDLIGWDPRGVGESTPVQCGTPAQTDAYMAHDVVPHSAQDWASMEKMEKDFAAQCRKASGALLDHISTLDTVRDLDYLRSLVGEPKLDLLGVSYGTYLGATYAELYPQRTGRMVLDSAVNITDDDSVVQQMGFELALKNWATWCVANQSSCGLGSSQKQVIDAVTGLFAQLGDKPVPAGVRQLTQALGVDGVSAYLYGGVSYYRDLADAVTAARQGNGMRLLGAAEGMKGRLLDGSYDSLAYAFPAIACLDSADDGLAGAKKEWVADSRKAPVMGYWFGPGVGCTWWSARPVKQLVLKGKGAAPILVLGATGDPATPYQQAVSMAKQLDSGVLLTWKGAGHSVWQHGNACAKDAVKAFVVDGKVPANNTTC